jgi:hypothetical protein
MELTNDRYVILLRHTRTGWVERYYRDQRSAGDRQCWVKVSARGNEFRATAEQVLNHLLPALAGLKPGLAVAVEHRPAREE